MKQKSYLSDFSRLWLLTDNWKIDIRTFFVSNMQHVANKSCIDIHLKIVKVSVIKMCQND